MSRLGSRRRGRRSRPRSCRWPPATTGCPLEALRFDVTPPGLHYLLTHYDIPVLDPAGFRLVVDGLVDTPLALDLEDDSPPAADLGAW